MVADPEIMIILTALRETVAAIEARLGASPPSHPPMPTLGIKDAARKLGVHEKTVRRWALSGAGVMIGGRWRIDVARLQSGWRP